MGDKKAGEILLKYRVMPEGLEVDLAKLEAGIAAALVATGVARLSKAEAKPFAFGMKSLNCSIVCTDADGNNDKVEAALQGVPGAQGVEFLEAGRLM
ncbi:MAG: elongation factor 1-beta [Candidatus Thermoplasmatota archaeon]